jgi:hypothetical protein
MRKYKKLWEITKKYDTSLHYAIQQSKCYANLFFLQKAPTFGGERAYGGCIKAISSVACRWKTTSTFKQLRNLFCFWKIRFSEHESCILISSEWFGSSQLRKRTTDGRAFGQIRGWHPQVGETLQRISGDRQKFGIQVIFLDAVIMQIFFSYYTFKDITVKGIQTWLTFTLLTMNKCAAR